MRPIDTRVAYVAGILILILTSCSYHSGKRPTAVSDINTALAARPSEPNQPRASFGTYGEFHTGMSQAQALAALGPGATTYPLTSGCAQLFPARQAPAAAPGQGSVLTQNGKFLSYFLPAGVSTDRNIHPGSTVAQLRAAYSDAVVEVGNAQAGFYASVYPKGRPDEAIDFAVSFPIPDGTTSMPAVPDSAGITSVAGIGMTGAAVGFEYCSGG